VLEIHVVKVSELKEKNIFKGSSLRYLRRNSVNVVPKSRMLKCRDCSAEEHCDAAACFNALSGIGQVSYAGE